MKKLIVVLVVLLAASVPVDARNLELLGRMEVAAFPQVSACTAFVPSSFDTCQECQGRSDEEIDLVQQNGGSACAAYTAGANWCWYNCSPCSFCVRYQRIATAFCT